MGREVVIVELQFDQKEALSRSVKLKQAFTQNQKALKDLTKETQGGTRATAFQTKELIRLETAVKKDKKEFADLAKSTVTAMNAQKASTKTVEGLRSRLSGLTSELNKTEIGSKRFKELQVETLKTSDKLKGLEKSVGDNRRSVGDYSGALEGATGNLSFFGVNVGKLVGGLTKVTGATAGSSKGFNLLKIAIAGTGIGLILIALAALSAAFKNSEAGQNKFAKLMDVIGVIVGNLTDLLANFGEAIIEAVENPQQAIKDLGNFVKENITNRFEGLIELIPALGEAIVKLFEGDFAGAAQIAGDAVIKVGLGVEDATAKATAAISGFVEQTAKEVEEAKRLADLRAETDIAEREQIKNRARLEADVANLRLKAKLEEEFTTKERIAFLREANTIQSELLATDQVIAENRAEIQRIFNTFSKSTKENLDAEAEAEAEVARIQAARATQARSIQRELNTLNDEARAEENKINSARTKEAIAATKIAIELSRAQIDAEIGNLEEGEEKRIAIENERAKREAEAIRQKFGNTEAADALLLELEKTHQDNLTAIEKAADEERFLDQQENRLLAVELTILQDEEDLAAKIEFLNLRTATILANEQLTEDQRRLIIAKNEKAIEKTKDDARTRSFAKDQQNVRDVQKILGALGNFVSAQKQLELQEAGDNADKKKEIEKKFADKQLAINIAQIIASTALSIMQAFAQLGPIAGAIGAVLIGATGLVQIASAVKQRNAIKSLGRGGVANSMMVGGDPHSGGGTQYWGEDGNTFIAERDELITVLNKNSTGMLKGLSNLNQAGGGVKFAHSGGVMFQDGGITQRNISEPLDTRLSLGQQLISAIQNLPRPVVTIEAINAGQQDTIDVEARGQV